VLRISKSGVVSAWRERERQLRARGADLTLVSAARWEEGGTLLAVEPCDDSFVVPVRTVGHHPNFFLYDPRPLWRLLRTGGWDLIDMQEEPFGLAAAEVRLLMRLRCPHVPFVIFSAQNIDKRYPVPFRWFERSALRAAAGATAAHQASHQKRSQKVTEYSARQRRQQRERPAAPVLRPVGRHQRRTPRPGRPAARRGRRRRAPPRSAARSAAPEPEP